MGCAITKSDDNVMPPTRSDNNFKARLEHKLYLARENPEPVFDLSECNLKSVPQGIFSLCNVFRKEILLLNDNQLTSLEGGGNLSDLKLLIVLDLHKNAFVHLNPAINLLANLTELYLNDNQLKRLPDSLCELCKLQVLNVDNNRLDCLPENLGNLNSLRQLCLRGNSKITIVPYSLCRCRNLNELCLDDEFITEPPSEILQNGLKSVLKYFADKYNIDYDETDRAQNNHSDNITYYSNKTEDSNGKLEEKISQLEKIKEQRHAEYLAFGQLNEEFQKQETELRDAERQKKEMFLKDLVDRQDKLETEVLRLQKEKDSERRKLIGHLMQVESTADSVIKQMLTLRNNSTITQSGQWLEQMRAEEEKLNRLLMYGDSGSKRNRAEEDSGVVITRNKSEILQEMKRTLEADILRSETVLKSRESDMDRMREDVLRHELDTDLVLGRLFERQTAGHSALVGRLLLDERAQFRAVAALAQRADTRSWCLVQQVRVVERQLAQVTRAELKRRRLECDGQTNDLARQRTELSSLLVDLLRQRSERRSELIDTLSRLERSSSAMLGEDYWLVQYQRLLDSIPERLRDLDTDLDPALTRCLLQEGAIHCLPFLARMLNSGEDGGHADGGRKDTVETTLLTMDDEKLSNFVRNSSDRAAISRAVRCYKKELLLFPQPPPVHSNKDNNNKIRPQDTTTDPVVLPGAPDMTPSCSNLGDADVNTTTMMSDTECVICMDNTCEVIFIPCGHMCCCLACSGGDDVTTSTPVTSCPMCRADIRQRIRVIAAVAPA